MRCSNRIARIEEKKRKDKKKEGKKGVGNGIDVVIFSTV